MRTGDLFNWDWSAITYEPQWVFLGEVKATMKGTHVKSTGEGGWLESYQWNKHNLANWDEVCDWPYGI